MSNQNPKPANPSPATSPAPEANSKPQVPFSETMFFRRFVATAADYVIICTICMLSNLLIFLLFSGFDGDFFKLTYLINGLVWGVGGVLLLIKDGPHSITAFDCRTPGKYFLHVRVTDDQKRPITYEMSIKRNLVVASSFLCVSASCFIKSIDLPLITNLLLLISGIASLACLGWTIYESYLLFKSKDERRPGDILANTFVEYY
ncbi:MAG: RDD family protein [Candidatus Riflebacteria bacterium]|nr:RDD family protein [Candidatus Riflebacteria bacterium]